MPPKIKFTNDDVIQAAMRVVEEKGLSSLAARNVDAFLRSSSAPVYYHFANMDDLDMCVVKETERMLLEYTSKPYSDRVFLNMGTGVVVFACEHPLLDRALMLEGGGYGEVVQDFLDTLASEMIRDNRFTALPD